MSSDNKFMTPECAANWLWLFKPNEKFGAVYSVTCIMDETEPWRKLIATLTNLHNQHYDEVARVTKKRPKRCEYMPWKQQGDGLKVFVVKNNAEGRTKDGKVFSTKPTVVGPDGKPLTEDMLKGNLANGTSVRVGFVANCWVNDAQGVGLSARLQCCQVIKPVYGQDMGGYTSFDDAPTVYPMDFDLFNTRGGSGVQRTQEPMFPGLCVDKIVEKL